MNNFLSIDYWTKKSWLAYSVGSFCFPLKTVPTREILDNLNKIIPQKNISKIIIGMPYNIDWTLSKHCKNVQKFAKILEKNFPKIPIILYDERLTTSEARIFEAENNINIDIDTESARLILENFLEQK